MNKRIIYDRGNITLTQHAKSVIITRDGVKVAVYENVGSIPHFAHWYPWTRIEGSDEWPVTFAHFWEMGRFFFGEDFEP